MSTKMPWFRMYTDFLTDPKMISLAFEDQRHFIGVLALKSDGAIDDIADGDLLNRIVAQRLWIDHGVIRDVKKRLKEAGLIDSDWQPVAWGKRQFVSDKDATAAERKRRERAANANKHDVTDMSRVTNRDSHKDVTRLDTDTDTDKEEDIDKKNTRAIAPPDGVSLSVWQDFKKLRVAKKAPVTETALTKMRAQAAKAGVTLQVALETCCERGWTGFNADWVAGKTTPVNQPTETAYQRSKRELYERATGQHASQQAPQFVEVLGALQ